jgi:23S rRNA (cytosine1962-C5)-methyltransferase
MGIGLFNPRAKMPLRVVTHTDQPLGEEYFETAIRRAVALRRDLFKLDETTRRLPRASIPTATGSAG